MVVRIIMPKFDDYSIYPVILSLLDFFLEREKNLFDVFQNAFGMFLTNCIYMFMFNNNLNFAERDFPSAALITI